MITNKNIQSGRSMIEMLGVLAIIGVLSVGGIAGYSKAMMKFKVNKTVDQVTQIATNIRTLFGGQRDYSKLTDKVIVKGLLLPDEMLLAKATTTEDLGDATASEDLYENSWGHPVIVKGSVAKIADGDNKSFMITYQNVPSEACLELSVMDWGSSSGSGLVAFGVGNDGTHKDPGVEDITTVGCLGNSEAAIACANGPDGYRVPMDPARAATYCSSDDGLVNLYWKFY